ncbi:MAG: hypothetical protein CMJ18_15730 [Phycisphaeraceae bacterium]|nr:hypothetical protein [Phycisphaeraceae bacterium]
MQRNGVWTTRGFETFIQGTCGNAGQNLYISRAGVLQRIHQYDLNRNGFTDLVFCNAQDHRECVPTYVYRHPLRDASRIELPADGAMAAVVADLNGDGCDDLVLGMNYDGRTTTDLNAIIYWGGPGGWGEHRLTKLPAPLCTAVATGDFDGDGRIDLALLCHGRLRLFYQTSLGFEPGHFTDVDVEGVQLAGDDLDGDGHAELLVRSPDGSVRIYWGGAEGLDVDRLTQLPAPSDANADPQSDESPRPETYEEDVRGADASPLVKVIRLGGTPHVFVAGDSCLHLVPVNDERMPGEPIVLECPTPMSIAVGDVNGDGHADLVVAARQPAESDDGECSWVYFGHRGKFSAQHRQALASHRACDVTVVDLDGNGCDDIVICQNQTPESFSGESLIYRSHSDRIDDQPVRLPTEDARRVFAARPSPEGDLQLTFANHFGGGQKGKVSAAVYAGSADGFSHDRRCELPGMSAVEAMCCDVNDDGWPDVILANCAEMAIAEDAGSFIYLNGPDGFPAAPNIMLPTVRAHGAACADINRDGYLDLIFCGFDNPDLMIFHGTADGFEDPPQRIRLERDGRTYRESRWICLADLNHDGWLDLVVPQLTEGRSFILWGGPDGFSMERSQALSVIKGTCAQAADLTGNGLLDLIVGGHAPVATGPFDSFVYIYWNDGDGLREDNRQLLPVKSARAMAVADFNNDGRLDLFTCSYDDGRGDRDVDSYIYWNRPECGFSASDRLRLPTHSAAGCLAADFNEDGWIDLAVANHKTWGDHLGDSFVFWNGPDGFDPRRITRLPTIGPHGMCAVNPGNIVDRGAEEYYVSKPFELPRGACIESISWDADVPAKAWVKAQIRTAESSDELPTAKWYGPETSRSWYENNQAVPPGACRGRCVQYRLALGATSGGATPRVKEVRVPYGTIADGTS